MLDKLVIKFLEHSIEFKTYTYSVGTATVMCFKNTEEIYPYPTLVYDIAIVFNMFPTQSKKVIEKWAKEKYPLIDLDTYFKTVTELFLNPIVETTPIIIGCDPIGEFNSNISIRSRYSAKEINPNFYTTINLH